MNMAERLTIIKTPEEVFDIVKSLAGSIRADYASKDLVLIGVLKGALFFTADLLRFIGKDNTGPEVDFIQTACYGAKDEPSDKVLILRDITSDIKGRHVLIVEDIIDRGHTARALADYFKLKGAASIRICALLVRGKPGEESVKPDYAGLHIGKGFVVGYGMDYKERYRGLAGLHIIEDP